MRKSVILMTLMMLVLMSISFGAVTINTPSAAFSTNATTATWQFKANSTLNLDNMTFFMSNSAGTNTTLFTNATAGTVFSGSATFTGYSDGNYTLYARGGNTTLAGSLANIEIDSTTVTMTCTSAAQTSNPVTITCTSTENSKCRIAQQSRSYNQMSTAFGSGYATSHSYEVTLGDGSHTWYASCLDRSGNDGTTTITFSMDAGKKTSVVTQTPTGVAKVTGLSGVSAKQKALLLFTLFTIIVVMAVLLVMMSGKKRRR